MQKHILNILVGFFSGLLLYFYISYSENYPSDTGLLYFLAGMSGIGIAYLVQYVNYLLDKALPWKLHTGSRLLVGVVFITVTCWVSLFFLCYLYSGQYADVQGFLFRNLQAFLKLAILLLLLALIYSTAYFALYSYLFYERWRIDNLQAQRKQTDLRLKVLKTQLSPHFLFNSLNTVSALIDEDPQKARVFIRKLAQSYQYTLISFDKQWVTLEEELNIVHSFQYLLETRFEKNLQLRIQIPDIYLKCKIPPLTLQLLVENAVKHNVMSADNPLIIDIGADKKWIWVSNNKTQSPSHTESLKIGLKNIRERYKLLVNKNILVQDSDKFTIKLPLVS